VIRFIGIHGVNIVLAAAEGQQNLRE
jgi:hypothetical protein